PMRAVGPLVEDQRKRLRRAADVVLTPARQAELDGRVVSAGLIEPEVEEPLHVLRCALPVAGLEGAVPESEQGGAVQGVVASERRSSLEIRLGFLCATEAPQRHCAAEL